MLGMPSVISNFSISLRLFSLAGSAPIINQCPHVTMVTEYNPENQAQTKSKPIKFVTQRDECALCMN